MEREVNRIICPQCMNILRLPFETCGEGHLLCNYCKQHIDAISELPVESAACGNEEFLLPILKRLHRNLTDECIYGCGHCTNIVDLADHEKTCTLNSKCAITSCSWNGGLSKLVKHVEYNHPWRLVDLSVVDNNFTVGFEYPILLLTQLDKNNPNNDIYWLRLYKETNNQYILIQYQGHIGEKVAKNFTIREYSVSPINYTKLSISEKIFIKSDKENILNDEFMKEKGTDITLFNSEEYMIKMKELSPEFKVVLESFLKCLICLELMSAPIRFCVSGHSICGACCEMINNKCPQCNKEMTSFGRNYALEGLAEDFLLNQITNNTSNETVKKIPCMYKESGCQFTNAEDMLVCSHVMVCEYQPRKCFYTDTNEGQCQWEGPRKEIVQHVKTSHTSAFRCLSRVHLCSFGNSYCFSYETNMLMSVTFCNPAHGEYVVFIVSYMTNINRTYYFEIEIFNKTSLLSSIVEGSCRGFEEKIAMRLRKDFFKGGLLDENKNFSMVLKIFFAIAIPHPDS